MIQKHICFLEFPIKLIKIELLEKINIFKIHRGFLHIFTVWMRVGSAIENNFF